MGSDPWGSVMKPMVGNSDMAHALSQACGFPISTQYVTNFLSALRISSPFSQYRNQTSSNPPLASQPAQAVESTLQSDPLPSSEVVVSSAISSSALQTASVSQNHTSTLQHTAAPTAPPPETSSPPTTIHASPTVAPTPPPQQPSQNNPPSSGGSTSSNDISTYLSAHNSIRAEHGAAPLSWSDQLAGKAQQWANGCVFRHSGGSLGPFGGMEDKKYVYSFLI